MGRILKITVELFSAVSPARLSAFGKAIRSAVEASGMWKKAPPLTPTTIPWHIVKVSSAAEVQAAKKVASDKALIHMNKTQPHKSFSLSQAGRYRWKLELYSWNLDLTKRDIRDALSAVSVRDTTHTVRLCEVESINISSRPVHCGKPPGSSEITLNVKGFICSALVSYPSGYRLYWGVYVRRVSWLTRPYLVAIEPFRHVLYPAMLRRIRRAWLVAYTA